jgi:hypothetical protein
MTRRWAGPLRNWAVINEQRFNGRILRFQLHISGKLTTSAMDRCLFDI